MTNKQRRFVEWWKQNYYEVILGTILLTLCAILVPKILYADYFVEELDYVDVDFEWVDDFQNYEVVIPYEEHNYYLTFKDSNVKFIYTNEDFLNFVAVNHSQRIIDKEDHFSIKAFYINLNYKEIEQ